MYEIEVKAVLMLGSDEDELYDTANTARTELLKLGASEKDRCIQTDIYLNHPSVDYKLTDEAFRIRCQEWPDDKKNEVRLTYKGPRISERTKTRKEEEVLFDPTVPVDRALSMFESIGFTRSREVVKERWTFLLDDLVLCVDILFGLGTFLEAEIGRDDIKEGERRVLEFMAENGWKDIENRSYPELMEDGQS